MDFGADVADEDIRTINLLKSFDRCRHGLTNDSQRVKYDVQDIALVSSRKQISDVRL